MKDIGEMIALNGSFYQLDLEGNARPVEGSMKIPFATMCHFRPMLAEKVLSPLSHEAFEEYRKCVLPSDNMCYALHREAVPAGSPGRSTNNPLDNRGRIFYPP